MFRKGTVEAERRGIVIEENANEIADKEEATEPRGDPPPPDLRIFVNAYDNDGELPVRYTITQDLNDKKIRTKAGNVIATDKGETLRIRFILADTTIRNLHFDRRGGAVPINLRKGNEPKPDPFPPGVDNKFDVQFAKRKKFDLITPATDTPTNYIYELKIIDDRTDPHYFDPIIENGGGHGRSWQWAALLVGGFCGLVVGLGVSRSIWTSSRGR